MPINQLTAQQQAILSQLFGIPVSSNSTPTQETQSTQSGVSPIAGALVGEGFKEAGKGLFKAVTGSGAEGIATEAAPYGYLTDAAGNAVGTAAAPTSALGTVLPYAGPAIALGGIANGAYQTLTNKYPAYTTEFRRKQGLVEKGILPSEALQAPSKEDPTIGKPWEANTGFRQTRNLGELRGSDIYDAAAFYESDPTWGSLPKEERIRRAQAYLDGGVVGEGHGTIVLNNRKDIPEGQERGYADRALINSRWDKVDQEIANNQILNSPNSPTPQPQAAQSPVNAPQIPKKPKKDVVPLSPIAPPGAGGLIQQPPTQPPLKTPQEFADSYLSILDNNLGYDLTNPLNRIL